MSPAQCPDHPQPGPSSVMSQEGHPPAPANVWPRALLGIFLRCVHKRSFTRVHLQTQSPRGSELQQVTLGDTAQAGARRTRGSRAGAGVPPAGARHQVSRIGNQGLEMMLFPHRGGSPQSPWVQGAEAGWTARHPVREQQACRELSHQVRVLTPMAAGPTPRMTGQRGCLWPVQGAERVPIPLCPSPSLQGLRVQ